MVTRRRTAQASTRAFALVDVIVATVILGAALSVMISLAGRAIGTQARGSELATAARLADEQLQLVLTRGPENYAQRYTAAGPCDPPFERYNFRLDFSGGASTGEPYRVGATISWTSSAVPQSVTIETLVASRDAGQDGDPDPIRKPDQPIVRQP